MISNQAIHYKESEGKKMADWQDTFKRKMDDQAFLKRQAEQKAEQTKVQSQAQYAAINRGGITTADKQITSQKLQTYINNPGPGKYAALAIVRILINFKSNEKKGGDANQAVSHLLIWKDMPKQWN